MGQQEVLNVLSKSKWLSVKDIAKLTNIGVSSTTMACKRLRKYEVILWKHIKTHNGVPYYVYKLKGNK
jgi:predicted transcriptional regulator